MMLKNILFVVLIAFKEVQGIRSREEWEKLFLCDARRFKSEDALLAAQTQYLDFIKHKADSHPYVLRYTAGCGQVCHDEIRTSVNMVDGSHYGIVNKDHSIVHLSPRDLETLREGHGHHIRDFAPILPKMKIDKKAHLLGRNCDLNASSSKMVPLHVTLMPISDEQIHRLVSEAPVGSSPSEISDFSDIVSSTLSSTVVISTPCSLAETIMDYLSEQSVVQWIEIRGEIKLLGNLANGVVQSGDAEVAILNIANLTGHGEIIGIADSGLDMYSCFFHDINVAAPYDVVDYSHRKVIYYHTIYADDTDADGHGTLVCSTAAGKVPIQSIFGNTGAEASDAERATVDSVNDQSASFSAAMALPSWARYVIFGMQRALLRMAGRIKDIGFGYSDSEEGKDRYDAAAYNSKISFFDIGKSDGSLVIPADINNNLFKILYDTGARVQSMSWGSATSEYDTDARNVDVFMWHNSEALILVAGGNTGEDGPGSIGSPATSKNGVSVGASLNDKKSWEKYGLQSKKYFDKNSLAWFSSRGPTFDNRNKPDICAPGWYITGAANMYPSTNTQHCNTGSAMGTSFSSPLLGSHAVLAREYFTTGYYPSGERREEDGFVPSGALLKAVLVHGASSLRHIQIDDLKQENTALSRGDNNQGYGRALIEQSLSFGVNASLDSLTYFVVGAAHNSSNHYAELSSNDTVHNYTFFTANKKNLSPIRVTLCYTDYYPAAGVKDDVLINDLGITLWNGSHYFYPEVTNLEGKYDQKNNIEVILMFAPPPNTNFTVTVTAHSLSITQPYALIISGEIGEYPYKKKTNKLVVIIAIILFILLIGVMLFNCCYGKRRKKKDQRKVAVEPISLRRESVGDRKVRPVERAHNSLLL